ncbi:MAG: 50S ribosomal protein L13 [Nitrososphaeria archaeon]
MVEPGKIIVVDGSGHILGRLASKVAKLLLEGNHVVIVNAEKILLSGNRKSTLNEFLSKLEIKSRVNPEYGPYHPRRPENIVSRTVKGMLPMRKSKGALAYDRLKVFTGTPKEYEKVEKVTFPEALAKKPISFYISVGEVSQHLVSR